ncbi:MAG: PDZ domain-containing protein [Bacteroidia bacterium]
MITTNQIKTTLSALCLALFFSFSNSAVASDLNDKALANSAMGMEYKMSPNSPIGIQLTNVYNQGVAQLLGLKKKDVLVGIGNQPITLNNLTQVLKSQTSGENIKLRVERNNQMVILDATMPAIFKRSDSPAFLGIETGKSGKENVLGVEVMSVLKGSTAKEAGIKKGDLIIGLDNDPVVANNLSEIIKSHHAGDIVTVRIQRGGNNLLIKTVLSKKSIDTNGSTKVFTQL